MSKLTLEQAKKILPEHITQEHLIKHSLAVSKAMGAMAERFGEDKDHWEAIGYIHDVDYEKYPEEHLGHTREILSGYGVDEEDIHSVITHGYSLLNDEKPETNMEKSLFTVDELTGIIQAASLMRPTGISVIKKFKDKAFAAKCDRALILSGCEMLGMELNEVVALLISGMQEEADNLGLGIKE